MQTDQQVAAAATDADHLTPQQHIDAVQAFVRPGDLLTITRCCGFLEEYRFTGRDGPWLTGETTDTTFAMGALDEDVNDIAPQHVTHINRDPIAVIVGMQSMGYAVRAKHDERLAEASNALEDVEPTGRHRHAQTRDERRRLAQHVATACEAGFVASTEDSKDRG